MKRRFQRPSNEMRTEDSRDVLMNRESKTRRSLRKRGFVLFSLGTLVLIAILSASYVLSFRPLTTSTSTTLSTDLAPSQVTSTTSVPISQGQAVMSERGWRSSVLSATYNTSAISSISCPEIKTCVAVGVAGQSASTEFKGYSGLVLTTSDDGQNWKSSTLPSGIGGLSSVSCNSSALCIAVGEGPGANSGAIISSSDFGSTWKEEAAPQMGKLAGLSCSATGFCMAFGRATGGQVLEVATLISNTWNAISTESLAQSTKGCSNCAVSTPAGSTTIQSVTCESGDYCILGGTVTNAQSGAENGFISVTTNGGVTWSKSSLPISISSIANVVCQNGGPCLAGGTISSGNGSGPGIAAVLTSSDSGATWKVLSQVGAINGLTDLACYVNTCMATGYQVEVQRATSGSPLVSITESVVLESNDGGTTWQSVASLASGNELLSVGCDPQGSCMAGGTTRDYQQGIVIHGSN